MLITLPTATITKYQWTDRLMSKL